MPKLLLLIVAVFLSACVGITREPLEVAHLQDPQVPGIPEARFWADVTPENLIELIAESESQLRASGLSGDHAILTLSGGAEDGAFAAGILNAWSDSGTRPVFRTVTGISTGALAAPFAFLGSDYDADLKLLYGGLQPEEILQGRSVFSILPQASLKNSAPLKKMIERYVTEEFLARIAAEHRRGRRPFVQSTSLDAQRPVLWNLGAIADSGAPNAASVFADVLLASASLPGLFPPVLIEVETPYGVRDELHVDGGVVAQSAFLPNWDIADAVQGRSTL